MLVTRAWRERDLRGLLRVETRACCWFESCTQRLRRRDKPPEVSRRTGLARRVRLSHDSNQQQARAFNGARLRSSMLNMPGNPQQTREDAAVGPSAASGVEGPGRTPCIVWVRLLRIAADVRSPMGNEQRVASGQRADGLALDFEARVAVVEHVERGPTMSRDLWWWFPTTHRLQLSCAGTARATRLGSNEASASLARVMLSDCFSHESAAGLLVSRRR